MKYCILFLCLLANIAIGGSLTERQLEDMSRNILLKVVNQIANDGEGKRFFGNLTEEKLKAVELLEPAGDFEGWRLEWNYRKDVKYVKNTDKLSPARMLPTIEGPNGILFDIFIAYKQGDTFKSRIKNYTIIDNPRLILGYYLKTQNEEKDLTRRLDEIIKKTIAELGKR